MIACFGGTFDPVHNGHLEAAKEVLTRAVCEEVRLIPCHIPPHRGVPHASPAHRLAMLELAVADCPGLVVDARELTRDGPSYTVETLRSLRQDYGPDVALGWVLGVDAAATLEAWEAWQRLPELAHLLLLDRPGVSLPTSGPVADLLAPGLTDEVADLHRVPAGHTWRVRQPQQAVSATEVRRTLATGRSAAHLLPVPVWAYIRQQGLYGCHGVPGHSAESE
ncbi:MAG: nicotinate-nucleotide adenylyltransferase [Gammaproteobacteria bacterium]|nr:MAG: nicotinate-nucleotide adenylyltransferase [Gammaproteobacteria bacterium]